MEDVGGTEKSLEVRVAAAMRARLNDFKDQADTLTLEGVRRVLEKDLGLKTLELDSHKKFIKQCMDKYFYGPTESTEYLEENPVETAKLGRDAEIRNKSGSPESEFEDQKELSSLSRDAKKKTKDIKSVNLDEGVIKKAIQKRAKYFRENSGNITMAGVRRLLEEDLKFERKSLDKYKELIGKQLDEILSSEVVEPSNGTNKSKSKKSAYSQEGKGNKKPESTSGSDDSANPDYLSNSSETDKDSNDSDSEEVEVKERKKRNTSEKGVSAPVPKKQKISSKKSSASGRKKSEEHGRGSDSEDNLSDSAMEESSKKKSENPTPIYGKKVEHLKSVIKACGMSVPPSVYKRAKQAPDNRHEAFLIKELEGILEKEGLSRNPSEKEIKAVRKNKERAKELEGIDLSNIVSSSRRRTTASFVPPKPQIPLDESEEEEEEEDEEDTDDENSQSGGSSEGSEEEEGSD